MGNGQITWPTWPYVTLRGNPKLLKIREFDQFCKFHLPVIDLLALMELRCCDVFETVQRLTYDAIGQWPDLTWKWGWCHKIRLESKVRYTNLKPSITSALTPTLLCSNGLPHIHDKSFDLSEIRTQDLPMYQKHGVIYGRISRKRLAGLELFIPKMEIKML